MKKKTRFILIVIAEAVLDYEALSEKLLDTWIL